MPPKKKKGSKGKKSKKGKKSGGKMTPAVIDGISSSEMTSEQLEEHLIRLKEELEREREERNYFQLERDKINTFWEISKRQLDERRAEMRNKDREMEEAIERHQTEVKIYKQKIKHVMYEHLNIGTELQTMGVVQLKLNDDEHRCAQNDLRVDNRLLNCDLKRQQLSNEDNIKDLRLCYENQKTIIRINFEHEITEVETKFHKKMKMERHDMDLERRNAIHDIEEGKNAHICVLMKTHEKAFSDIKNYYNDITLNNLALINLLKEQMEELNRKQERTEKCMSEIMAENRRLVEPLKKAQEENNEFKAQLDNYQKDKLELENTKASLIIREKELKDLEWKQEVLHQRFDTVQKERDELYQKFIKSIQDVQQKSGLKNILLERKVKTLNESLEKKEAQLNEVLSASNLDPNALAIVTRKLEDVLDSKNSAIKDLQYELTRVCKAHNDQQRTYEAKLTKFGIPVEELGFKPLESTLGNQSCGYGPA